MTFKRPLYTSVLLRLKERRRFIQVLCGPRQSGKTTLIRQVLEQIDLPSHYASADEPGLEPPGWLAQQWAIGRLRAAGAGGLLVLDEIQKIPGWSATVKRLWDEDTASGLDLRVVLLGSAPLLVQRGLTESLAGRFEVTNVPHWSFAEMRDAFGLALEEYIYYGGYPGSVSLIGDAQRWSRYIADSLIETALSRDILHMTRVDKPALLRRLFLLSCEYSGQVLSYQKMLGQLQEQSNTTTLAHYLDLFSGAWMVTGLQKFAGQKVRQRGSSPKLLALNTALMSAQSKREFASARQDRAHWGRLVETAVGAHLVNGIAGASEVYYWRDRSREVDFVLSGQGTVTAVEVKSGRPRGSFPGMDAFEAVFGPVKRLVVGGDGLPLEEFLGSPPEHWID